MAQVVEPNFHSLPNRAEGIRELLAGSRVLYVEMSGKSDLSDWVALMEAVEALCPVWPEAAQTTMKCSS